jgi:hypothetical protein
MNGNKRLNFETKKSIHINLTRGTHASFRAKLFEKGLSMQEVLEELAIRVSRSETYMEEMLNELVEIKISGDRKMAQSDAESIYRLIKDK